MAARDAHVHQAQVALKHMQEQIEHSKKAFTFMQKFRIRMIFATNKTERYFNKIMWILGVIKVQFVLIADYQMV